MAVSLIDFLVDSLFTIPVFTPLNSAWKIKGSSLGFLVTLF